MPNEEHLELINQGVDAWNGWRDKHVTTQPDLNGANLSWVNLSEAELIRADLSMADLTGADLTTASLVETNLENANLNGCRIYGISAWNIKVNQETKQSDLIITQWDEATIKFDDIQVAQFIYLILKYKNLRNVLNAVTKHGVLILGRFGGGGLEVGHDSLESLGHGHLRGKSWGAPPHTMVVSLSSEDRLINHVPSRYSAMSVFPSPS
jgi:Pentapeptide repeats (8 copies)